MTIIYKTIFLFFFMCINLYSFSQSVKLLTSGTNTSIRGLSAVNDRVIWVSGSNGTVGRSLDSGNTFKWTTIKGFEKTDFRDIEAFDESAAVIMSVAEPAYIPTVRTHFFIGMILPFSILQTWR